MYRQEEQIPLFPYLSSSFSNNFCHVLLDKGKGQENGQWCRDLGKTADFMVISEHISRHAVFFFTFMLISSVFHAFSSHVFCGSPELLSLCFIVYYVIENVFSFIQCIVFHSCILMISFDWNPWWLYLSFFFVWCKWSWLYLCLFPLFHCERLVLLCRFIFFTW